MWEEACTKNTSVKDGKVRQSSNLAMLETDLDNFFQLFIYILTNQFAAVLFKYAIKFRDSTLDAKVLLLPIELCKNRQKVRLR